MKQKIYILFFLMLILSCQKDAPVIEMEDDTSSGPPTETIFEYFQNYNGEFINEWMPGHMGVSANCPEIIDAGGYSYVIPGGNNKITVNFHDYENDVCHLLYGVVGAFGYYKVAVPSEQNEFYDLVVLMSKLIKKNNFVIKISLEDEQGNISNPYYIPVVLKTAQSGDLQICLSFDHHNDLDLHVIEPGGFEIYWHDTISPNGGILDLDANANCVFDSVNNENIIYNDTIPIGCFEVWAVYYKQCIPNVNTSYTVTALLNGQPVSVLEGSNPYTGVFPNGTDGYAVQVMKFDVGNIYRIAHFQFGRFGSELIKQEIVTEKPPE